MKSLKTILFAPFAFYAGAIDMFGTWVSYPIFILLNPKYQLPDDKAAIDVAPVTSYFWKLYEGYCVKNFRSERRGAIPFVETISVFFTVLVSVFLATYFF